MVLPMLRDSMRSISICKPNSYRLLWSLPRVCSEKEGPRTFVAKFFKGADLSYLEVMMKQLFKDVYVVKPESSRASSAEAFVIGIGYFSGK